MNGRLMIGLYLLFCVFCLYVSGFGCLYSAISLVSILLQPDAPNSTFTVVDTTLIRRLLPFPPPDEANNGC